MRWIFVLVGLATALFGCSEPGESTCRQRPFVLEDRLEGSADGVRVPMITADEVQPLGYDSEVCVGRCLWPEVCDGERGFSVATAPFGGLFLGVDVDCIAGTVPSEYAAADVVTDRSYIFRFPATTLAEREVLCLVPLSYDYELGVVVQVGL